MAIRREFRKFYGPAWRRYRAELIAIHGNRCTVCDREITKWLNLCHTSHDPRTSSVTLLCAADHNRHDAGHRLAMMRRSHAKRVGQGWLWVEVQWAPFPAWLVPRRAIVREDPQEGLFR